MQTDKAENPLLPCMTFALDMAECVIVFYNMCWTMGCPKWVVFRCPSVSRCDYLWWKHSWEWEKSVSKILTLSKVSSLPLPLPSTQDWLLTLINIEIILLPPSRQIDFTLKRVNFSPTPELTLHSAMLKMRIWATHQTARPDKISTCLDHVLTCPDKKLENN